MSAAEYHWYPVCTLYNAEKKAYEALSAKGIEAYMPLKRELRQWSDRKKWVHEPFIKSYLFVRINQQQQTEVLMTKGIVRFIYFSGKVATMPDRQIAELKLLLANESELEISDHVFEKGEEVVLKAGPLQGLRGEIVSFHSEKRFIIRIDYIGKTVVIQTSALFVEPV
jgi:transcriptional antiterminator RfaH